MTLGVLFAKRQARFRWAVLLPAAIALYFGWLAGDDVGLLSALPYLAVALLTLLYGVRPAYALWALPFAGFSAYVVFTLLEPLIGFEGAPLTERLAYLALGVVPTFLLWLSRPREIAPHTLPEAP